MPLVRGYQEQLPELSWFGIPNGTIAIGLACYFVGVVAWKVADDIEPLDPLAAMPVQVRNILIRIVGGADMKLYDVHTFVRAFPSQGRAAGRAKPALHSGGRLIDVPILCGKADVSRLKGYEGDHGRTRMPPTRIAVAVTTPIGFPRASYRTVPHRHLPVMVSRDSFIFTSPCPGDSSENLVRLAARPMITYPCAKLCCSSLCRSAVRRWIRPTSIL